MTVSNALYDRLSNYAGLSALVSDRIYPNLAPQSVTLPYVVYERVSGTRIRALNADTDLASPRYQFSVYSNSYLEAESVIEQIRAALQRYTGTVGSPGVVIEDCTIESETDFYDAQTELHERTMDFLIWHRE